MSGETESATSLPATELNTGADAATVRHVLRRAAEQAALAPSVHNTQPWRFEVTADGLLIRADASRRLPVLDPRGRQLTVSCGCALFNARTAVAAAGFRPVVRRFPDPLDPSLVARVAVGHPTTSKGAAELDRAIGRRHTNRRPYAAEPLPDDVVARLVASAWDEGAELVRVPGELRPALTELAVQASAVEAADPAYVAELAAWTTDDLRRADGVQARNVPYTGDVDGSAAGVPDSVVRDFDLRGMGWLPRPGITEDDELLVVWTRADDARAWLRSGEALERVWLELTALGYWASPVGQVVEVRQARTLLRSLLGLHGEPQLALRVGRAPEAPPSRRRALDDTLEAGAEQW